VRSAGDAIAQFFISERRSRSLAFKYRIAPDGLLFGDEVDLSAVFEREHRVGVAVDEVRFRTVFAS